MSISTPTEPQQLEMMPLQHTALIPPRESHAGENVFSYEWDKLMSQQPQLLSYILYQQNDVEHVSQRQATVAASFIQWLGCNNGRDFIDSAMKLAQRAIYSLQEWAAYLAAWGLYNRRINSSPNGVRVIETILATEDCWRNGSLISYPGLSTDDYDTVESVVWWLSSDAGKDFVQRCYKLIDVRTSVSAQQSVRTIVMRKRP